jgi:hypothetical protein
MWLWVNGPVRFQDDSTPPLFEQWIQDPAMLVIKFLSMTRFLPLWSLGQLQQDVRIPCAIQSQRFVAG